MIPEVKGFIFGIKQSMEFKKLYLQWYLHDLIIVGLFVMVYSILDPKNTATYYLGYILVLLYSDLWHSWKFITTYVQDIRKGDLIVHLTRPINYIIYRFFELIGKDTYRQLTVIFFILPFFATSITNYLAFLLLFVASSILGYLIMVSIALISFWIYEPIYIIRITDNIKFFLSGAILPITFFPEPIKALLDYSPFSFIGYLKYDALIKGFEIYSFELVIAYFINLIMFALIVRFLWIKGLKRFEAQGG